MARWCIVVVLALVVAHTTARNVPMPNDAGFKDQKNFIGGAGGFSGVGDSGLPFAGAGAGVGGSLPGGLGGGAGGIGGVAGLGGLGGGSGGIGGLGGSGGLPGFGGLGGAGVAWVDLVD
ncbi:unnamed protein product [Malus baccata var. baccata]